SDVTVRSLLRAWKARSNIAVIHRFFKQNLGLGRCHCRTIQAQENWVWCVVEAFHAVVRVRRGVPGLTWRAAQRQAAQNAKKYVLTDLEQDGPLLEAA
ncbi:hypothetical protein, partial [Deinococcus sp. 23YEL01]|uniref:hypothetical protein n=1 Tax=Deinococcus sp. 23YEL01 TaxID=2745871 RepID=UPI001E37A016